MRLTGGDGLLLTVSDRYLEEADRLGGERVAEGCSKLGGDFNPARCRHLKLRMRGRSQVCVCDRSRGVTRHRRDELETPAAICRRGRAAVRTELRLSWLHSSLVLYIHRPVLVVSVSLFEAFVQVLSC